MRAIPAVLAVLLCTGTAQAQNCVGRPDFDRCMNAINMGNQARLAQSQQALMQTYIRTNGPWLQRAYAEHRARGGQMTPQQFAYWGLMTANGTNIAGAQQAQRDQFAGQQRAARTVQEGYDSHNRAWEQNSQRQTQATEAWTNGAIRGVAPYVNPQTGQSVQLPYAGRPGQPFNENGQTYVQDSQGNYRQWTGNGWALMSPGR